MGRERERDVGEEDKNHNKSIFFFKLNFREREVGEEDKSHNKSKFFFFKLNFRNLFY